MTKSISNLFFSSSGQIPFEWYSAFDNSQQPLSNPLVIQTGQSIEIESQNSEMLIADNYLKKIGSSTYGSNNIRSVEAVEKGLGRLVGFKVIPNVSSFIVGLAAPSQDSHNIQFQSSGNKITITDRFSSMDVGYTYVDNQVYYCYILLTDTTTAYYILFDSPNYYLLGVADQINHPNHDVIIRFSNSTQTLIDWFRINTIESLASQTPFDTDTLTLPTGGTPFTHDVNGWIWFKIGTATSSGTMEVKFRRQDANNYFSLKFNTTSQMQLSIYVAGVETVLSAYQTSFTSGSIMRVFINGSNIRIFNSETSNLKVNITNANFVNATDGEVTSLGNGVISYVHTMPFDITTLIGSI